METILEIKISHDGRMMIAWDPNAECEVWAVEIRETESPVGDAFRELAGPIAAALDNELGEGA